MEVKEFTSIDEVLQLMPMEVEIMKGEPEVGAMSLRDRLYWMDASLSQKRFITKHEFRVFVFYEEEKIVGYTVASLIQSVIKYFSEIRVYRAWRDKEFVDYPKAFWELIEAWAKQNKIHTIRINVNNQKLVTHFEDEYNFIPVSTVMEKKLL